MHTVAVVTVINSCDAEALYSSVYSVDRLNRHVILLVSGYKRNIFILFLRQGKFDLC